MAEFPFDSLHRLNIHLSEVDSTVVGIAPMLPSVCQLCLILLGPDSVVSLLLLHITTFLCPLPFTLFYSPLSLPASVPHITTLPCPSAFYILLLSSLAIALSSSLPPQVCFIVFTLSHSLLIIITSIIS